MGLNDRLYKIEQLLRSRKAVPIGTFLNTLEVSRATFRRDLDLLRERMNAPIVYDAARRGYRLGDPSPGERRHELPGLWFNSRELHALLAFHHFLEHLEPGLLSLHIAPLKERIEALLETKDRTLEEISRRIRVLPQAARRVEPAAFQIAAHALLDRQRLGFRYHGRGKGDVTNRTISPQRLVHYRDNWYLDAWDHGKRALRTFAVERIREPRLLDAHAQDIPEERLNRHFTESYGIFAGRAKKTARLRFSPERARWVRDEIWHPRQKSGADGEHLVLSVPYSDERELVMDILKFGPDVEVLGPPSLRKAVRERLELALRQYLNARKPDKPETRPQT